MNNEMLERAQGEGCSCPTCGQFVKVYKRTITSTMARQLIHGYKLHGSNKYFHVKDVVMGASSAGDFAKLQLWNIIEAKPHEKGEEGKRTSGYWVITDYGKAFLKNLTRVPKHFQVYNAGIVAVSNDSISIIDALGKKFDYNELMKN